MSFVLEILAGGWKGLTEYLSLYAITYRVPALFSAGVISVFNLRDTVLKYFGPKANKWKYSPDMYLV